jgi:hypothetical protein
VTDGAMQAMADEALALVTRVVTRGESTSLTPALGVGIRTRMFPPIDQLITGFDGECCLASNCTVPLGKARQAIGAIDAFFNEDDSLIQRHCIFATRIFLAVRDLVGVEPIIYWRDAMRLL